MKTIIKTTFLFVIFFGILAVSSLQAQSADEVKAMMDEISGLMRNIEQKFNKIALEPEQLKSILQQLLRAAQDKKPENLPESIKDYLESNPTILAELIDPNADEDKKKELKKMIRNSLQTDDGLNLLIRKYPQILDNLRQKEEVLTDALKKYLKDENDLQQIFKSTNDEMKETEEKLKELIELANKMQQKMNSQQKKKQEQEKEEEQQNEDKPQNPNENKPNENEPNEYQPNAGEDAKKTNPTDRNAWDNPLPEREYERTREARSGSKPKGYEEYSDQYFRALSQFERRHEEAQRNGEGEENSDDDDENEGESEESEENK